MNRRAILLFVVLLVGTAGDQITKILARALLAGKEPVSYLFGCIELYYVENDSGFLGYLSFLPLSVRYPLLTVGVLIALCAFALFLLRQQRLTSFQLTAGGLVLAGGAGNLLDRVLNNGGVTDFMIIGFGSFRTGIFNLGDLFILCGAFVLGSSLAERYTSADTTTPRS